MIDFTGVKTITILEGKVSKITRKSDGVVLWEKTASYINLAEPNDTNTTDWNIWINNARMGFDGSYRSNATSMLTNFIEMKPGEETTFYFSGMDIPENGFSSSIVGAGKQVAFFDTGASNGLNKSWIGGASFADFNNLWNSYLDYTVNSNGFVTSMTMGPLWINSASQFKGGPYYFRLALPITTDKSKIIITKNQPIS